MLILIKRYWFAGAIVLVAILAGAHLWLASQQSGAGSSEMVDSQSLAEELATTSSPVGSLKETPASTPSSATKKKLPPEPIFILPEGATPIDEYAYTYNAGVYFKPVVNAKKPLEILNADPQTFRRLKDMMTYPGEDIIRLCGAAPIYTFYVDKDRPYFYQIWRAPKFRSSHVDLMNGADASNFVITGPTSANDGRVRFDIIFQKVATSTCRLILNQTNL